MRSVQLSAFIFVLVLAGCAGEEHAQGSGNLLGSGGDQDDATDEGDEGDEEAMALPADAGDFLSQCARGGGSVGMIHVVFSCDSITVYSCKDISNVVLEFEDGERERFEGGLGQVHAFSGTNGGRIVGVWVKAGSNASGDGPGYGERFDAPDDECDPPGEGGSGGASGEGGQGGTGGTCGSNDPDEVCAGSGGSGGSSGTGSAGSGDEPFCTEGSDDPRCSVD